MAGKLQIAITGTQDQWLTGAPEISYFTSIFKRHSQFSTEAVELPLSGDIQLGSLLKCRVPSNVGDLVRSTILKIEIDTLSGTSNLYNTSIGTHVIQYADLKIGGQTIERITGDFIYMYNQLNNNTDETGTTLYYLTSHNRLSNPTTELYVHLPFYFFRNPSLAIPVCAITKQLVEIDIKFRDVDDDISFNYTSSNSINVRKRTTNGGIKNASIITDFYFVSEDERNFLLTRPIEYLITQLQVSKLVYKPNESKKSALLKFKNPVKEMFFVAKEEYSENPYQVEWYQVGSNLNGIEENESFGSSVAMSADGKRIAVGAMNHSSDDGEVRVYDNVEGQWTQVGPSIPGATNERFGQSISISSDGMRVAVGAAYGTETIKVYEYSNASWNKIFEASGVSGDQFGKTISISSDGKRVASGALSDTTNTGYARVYDIDSQTLLVQLAGASTNEYFGSSVSLNSDGTRLAVGADQYQNGNGYVKIYTESEGSWSSLGQISGESNGDRFGHAVSISSNGNRVAVGAYVHASNRGHVRIYEYSGGTWNKIGIDLDGEGSGDEFGFSVSLSSNGKRVMAGGPLYESDDRGVVKVYEETDGTWNQVFSNIGGGAGDKMGRVVSMSSDGNVIVAGSSLATSQDGKVVVYTCVVFENRLMDTTTNDQALTPLSTTIPGTNTFQITKLGQDIDGEAADDRFGTAVSMSSDGTRVAIGAQKNDPTTGSSDAGHVRVYEWNSPLTDQWNQVGGDIDGEAADDRFGKSVSMSSDGTRVAIGAWKNDSTTGSDAGHVRVYEDVSGTWTQMGLDIDGEAADDNSGHSVSISSDGTRVAIGAPSYFIQGTGHVRVYDYNPGTSPNTISITSDYTNSLTNIQNTYNGGNFGSVLERNSDIRLTNGFSNNNGIWFPVTFGSVWNVSFDWWCNGTSADDMRFNFYAPNQPTSGYASQHGGYYVFHEFFQQDQHTVRSPTDTDLSVLNAPTGSFPYALYPNNEWQTVTISYDNGVMTMTVSGGTWTDGIPGGNYAEQNINRTYTFTGTDLSNHQALWGTNTYVCISGRTGGSAGLQYIKNINISWTQTPASWTQVGNDIDGDAAADQFGYSVSMSSDGTRVAISAPGNNPTTGIDAGHVRVYEWNSPLTGQWNQMGQDIDGEAAGDNSGSAELSISSDGTRVAIGAWGNDGTSGSTSDNRGHVRVYEWNSPLTGQWNQMGQDIDGEAAGDLSGMSVSISTDGTRVAIGASGNDPTTGIDAGHVRVYDWNSGTSLWAQVGSDIDGEAAGDRSGRTVSMSSDGARVAIGAPTNDGTGGNAVYAGHVRVYSLPGTSNTDQTINTILSGKRSDYRSIKNIKFDCNGETIFDQSGQYLAYEQSLRHHTGCPSPVYEFYMYSFSLQPEMYYPTGQLNMSRIIHKKIDVELEDVSSLSKTNLSIYAQNYNVLHVESGLAGLKF